MIINCVGCGKSISTRISLCPYCKGESCELTIDPRRIAKKVVDEPRKMKWGILSFVLR